MKKSRIIVPALAMLTLSVAASVTGTVAWFTASRTASITLNDLVAIETAGALTMTLNNGNATVDSDRKTVALHPLRDFSYSVGNNKGYTALLNSDGNTVTGTREISNYTDPYGKFGTTDVYYANTFSATFSTDDLVNSYLFFNNNKAKSHVGNDNIGANSVYKALRVSMKATTSDDTQGKNSKIITWAPYTSLEPEQVYNVKEAATIVGGGVSTGATATDGNYRKQDGEGTSPIVETTRNVVKKADNDPVTEAHTASFANNSILLLSNKLIGGESRITVTVNFVIWFEGLDPDCLSGKDNLQSVASQAAGETISMGFYAIQEKAFAPAQGK